LPGNVNPVDQFQRAAYYSALLPNPGSQRQAVAGLMAVMRNVSVPFGAPYDETLSGDVTSRLAPAEIAF